MGLGCADLAHRVMVKANFGPGGHCSGGPSGRSSRRLERRQLLTASAWNNLSSTSANWNSAANWSPSSAFPNSASDSANLNVNLAVNQAVTLGANVTVNSLSLGDTTLSAGVGQTQTINAGSTLTFNNGSSAASLTLASGAVAGATIAAPISLASNLTIANNSSQTLTISGNIGLAGHSITITGGGAVVLSGALTGSSGGPSLIKQGSGTLTLSGAADNSYLLLDAEAGTVVLAKSSSSGVHAVADVTNIASGATVQLSGTGGDQIYDRPVGTSVGVTLSGGTLDLAGLSEGFDSLTGSGTVTDSASGTTSSLTLGTFNGSGTFDGTIQNGGGAVAIVKAGTGILTLTNSNTFSGGITIAAGTVQVGAQRRHSLHSGHRPDYR